MATVLGVHEIDLGNGADPAEFERRVLAVMAAPELSGLNVRLFKGDRGRRGGQYLLLLEIDSVETRDSMFPVPDSPDQSPVLQAYFEANPSAAEAWDRVMNFEPSTEVSTDYVEITG
jgi:hypothetical protein